YNGNDAVSSLPPFMFVATALRVSILFSLVQNLPKLFARG
ncbi:hypothetical protein MTO96_044579, partial [Rhipicephalus appendiculatus]